MSVQAWIEQVTIPTYGTGKPEKNPMFLEKRVYQGSSGVVYPHAVVEKIEDVKHDKVYTAVFLENEYLRIMVLPELGGRVQRAYDKVRNRDFVYYNQVVKPALVGLAGPWISGGIEFNWPQHHRPSTFSPVDHTIEEHSDGSKTVWVNETELMFRTKGMAGFTLHPGKAYLEIKGRLFNRSAFSQTFLWWANPAVKVNEHYQSVFPPDVYAVFDHGKRDVSDFPIATGTYYKVNYAPGTDISRYDTIPVPTSYMAIQSGYDFMGCYEHDTQAGMLHVADHHLSPGKKQWTWGNGDFGFAWDRNLTDEDGPYIELMTGVFTDNQPDFTWIQPNEGKQFEQYFMPYAGVGAVKNATKEAMVNLEISGQQVQVKVYATAVYKNAAVVLFHNNKEVKRYTTDLSPANILVETYEDENTIQPAAWKIAVYDSTGRELVSWQPEEAIEKTIPAAATAAKAPEDIDQVEDLFLNGLHLEQYRHATFSPLDYYREALRRSPGDVRCNNAMGLWLLRRGQFSQSETYFKTAIDTLTRRNPNPYDGEPYYNLGWSLLLQSKEDEAYDTFYKATWSDAWQHSGFLALAKIAARKKQYALALQHVENSLIRNYHSITARHLKTVLLRKLERYTEAAAFIQASVAIDPFNTGCCYEQYLLSTLVGENNEAALAQFQRLMRNDQNNYLELALDYCYAGCNEDAIALLEQYVQQENINTPLPYYYLGWLASEKGAGTQAKQYFLQGSQQKPDGCFPNKVEEILILQTAMAYNAQDAIAAYALGNCWYDKKQYTEAIACWEHAVKANTQLATPYRNLALAYYNKLKDTPKALDFMEQAFALDTTDARVFMELDQLYKITGRSVKDRLRMYEKYASLIGERDDLYLEYITLLNNEANFEKAKQLLSARKFHPWEGGEGKVVGQYVLCHIELAKATLLSGMYDEAITLLTELEQYPENMGEGKLYGTQENDIHYLLGCAYEGLQQPEQAQTFFKKATVGISEPVQAVYYNDPQPDKIVYQALAWRKLKQRQVADDIFTRFIAFGQAHIDDTIRIDYFAVSLPDMLVFDIDLNKRNRIHCLYLIGLGELGLGNMVKATGLFHEVLELDPNHQGAMTYLNMEAFFITGVTV
ncbi:MAG: DUF5107 domain-containing protein [Filimonas sp.]|nr:DUF5107 domain-containing protein [Filimonas sp.]